MKTLTEFRNHCVCIIEAAQKGFEYEKNAAKFLKPLGLVPANFNPAGAGHDTSDLLLTYNGKSSGCELKIKAASAGSLAIEYDAQKKAWKLVDFDPEDKEKQFLADMAEDIGIFSQIKKNWKEIPYRRINDPKWKETVGLIPKRNRYERDLSTFPDIRGVIDASRIEDYYNSKDTYYVNIGTHGFYLMGPSNPFKLKDVPRFGESANAGYRIRVQYKGDDSYQFVFELTFSVPSAKKSPFNIAPVDGVTVDIVEDQANLDCFPKLKT